MPSAPEFADAFRLIRIIKVLRKIKSHHFTQTYRHIRIAGKVKVNLKGKSQYSKPRGKHRQLACLHPLDRRPEHTDIVGYQNLFSNTGYEFQNSLVYTVEVYRSVIQLLSDIVIPHYWSCHYLGEKRDKCGEGNGIFLHLYLSHIHIYCVRH